ncbi:MAG: hypothetical protein K1X36_11865 [Pyrinomonadaceae bacterium]|nr:hypothetical protein [Pyrinomonadaceae bacterium]
MIAGFNTDIEFDGVVYHVQTEDKGLPSRKIISLVYDRGTILASKRTNYDDLAAEEIVETVVAERVQKQHKLICAAIRAGRINELKAMTAKASAAKAAAESPNVQTETAQTAAPTPVARVETQRIVSFSTPEPPAAEPAAAPIELPISVVTQEFSADEFFDAPIFEDVEIIEDDILLPAEAVAVVSELSGKERPTNQKLSIELLGESKFKGGDRVTVTAMICRGTDRKVVADAQIMVKVLGSSFRPVIFHAKSDGNGIARVHLQLPHFSSGRAALLLRASQGGEEIELRRIVTPG